MVSWIKSLWHESPTVPSSEVKSLVLDSNPINITPLSSPIVQTDVRQRRKMKRLRKSIDEQLKRSESLSLRPHEMGCNIETCIKTACFKRVPDKIVSAPYEVKR